MKKLGILMPFLLAVFMAQAANVTMIGDDGLGASSFNSAGQWSPAGAPSAGNDYFSSTYRLRTPADSVAHTFAGDSLTLDDTQTLHGTDYRWGLTFKGNATADITVDNLILNGGTINHLNASTSTFNLLGAINVIADSFIVPIQGPISIHSDISGSSQITIPTSGYNLTFYSPDSTFTGDIVNNGRFVLAAGTVPDPNAVLNFVVGADGVNNSVSGTGPVTAFNGQFNIDLTGAGTTPGDSWALVTASNVSYGATFAVTGFTDAGAALWYKDANSTTYQYDENTGLLSVYVPELVEDPISYFLFDAEYPVLNGDMTLPGQIVNPGWDGESGPDIPGWTATAPGTTDGGTGGGGTGDSADGDGWHAAVRSTDPNVYNIADANMVEGVTYAFTGQFAPRWGLIGGEMSVVADDDPNILLATAPITFPEGVDHTATFYPASVSYTATASDAGKKIGVYLDAIGDTGWLRFDDIHLYTGYLTVHGVIDQDPDGDDVAPSTPLVLNWTPTNDPNFNGVGDDDQILYYYIADGDGSNPNIPSYVDATGISKGIAAASHSIDGGIGYDQYCLWRVDTVIDGVTYTGKTILFTTLTADEVPDIVEWDWWRTWVGQPVTIWADVDDFGEGDLVIPDSFAWSVVNNDPNITVSDITVDPLYAEATVTTTNAVPGVYEVQLVVTDDDGSLGPQSSGPATFVINVYADACEAAINNGAQYNVYDSDEDCDVDLVDLAAFATQWLDDIKLEEAAAY